MENKIILSNYTKKTNGRYGEFSGEWFLNTILWPKINDICIKDNQQLEIDFNNVEIMPGFIDHAFVNLVLQHNFLQTNKFLIFKCNNKNIIADILSAITSAEFFKYHKVFTTVF